MNQLIDRISILLITSLLLLLATACGDENPAIVADNNDVQPNHQEGPNDSANSNSQTNAEKDGFQKPETSTGEEYGTRQIYDHHAYVNFEANCWGRDHMRWTRYTLESWLYPGEFFVRDCATVHLNHPGLRAFPQPEKMDVFVLHQGQRLPFKLFPVQSDDEWPTMDDIESTKEEAYSYNAHFDFNIKDDLFHNTIAIPPWAFPDEGAYNIQIMMVPRWDPDPDPYALQRVHPKLPSQEHTIYYGSEDFVEHESVPTLSSQEYSETWEYEVTAWYASYNHDTFLTPPREYYDWVDVDDARQLPFSESDSTIGDTIAIDQSSVTLDLHVVGRNYNDGAQFGDENGPIPSEDTIFYDTRGENLYVIQQDGEIIDAFFHEPPKVGYPFPGDGSQKGHTIPIEVDLPTDQQSRVQVFNITNPHDAGDHPKGTVVPESNMLILEYQSDAD